MGFSLSKLLGLPAAAEHALGSLLLGQHPQLRMGQASGTTQPFGIPQDDSYTPSESIFHTGYTSPQVTSHGMYNQNSPQEFAQQPRLFNQQQLQNGVNMYSMDALLHPPSPAHSLVPALPQITNQLKQKLPYR